MAFTSSSKSSSLKLSLVITPLDSYHNGVAGYQDDEISLNDGDAPTNLAILCLRKTSCSFPQSLHRSRRLPEMLLYFGFTTSSSSMHSITFPQSHEITCLGIEYNYTEVELKHVNQKVSTLLHSKRINKINPA